MAEFPAMPLFTDSWIADTAHLSRAERGLYMDLLILMWRSPECRMPNDIEWIMRRLRCGDDERESLMMIIAEFSIASDGNWLTQKRLKKEFDHQRKIRRFQSDRAKSRHKKEKDTKLGTAENMVSRSAPSTSTSTSKEKEVGLCSAGARDPLADLEVKLREAASWQSRPEPLLAVTGPIQALIDAGADLELDALPTIRALAPKCRSPNWKFFLQAIAQARDDRVAAAKIVSVPRETTTPGPRHEPAKNSRARNFQILDDIVAEAYRREAAGSDQGGEKTVVELPRLREGTA